MADVTATLEFSSDPLSDTSPTWVDVTDHMLPADWSDGRTNELDSPSAGAATFVLDNRDRRFEPEYAGVLANQVTNPSFESPADLDDWTSAGGTNTVSTNNETHGDQALRVVSTSSGHGMDYRQLSVVNGQRYYVAVDVRLAGGSGDASLRVSNGAGTQKAIDTASIDTRLELEFVADATASDWRIRLLTTAPGTSWDLYYDSVMIQEIDATGEKPSPIYVDGDQDNCRWEGTAHASASFYGGPYYPYVVPLRRFRLTLNAAAVDYDMGIWYVTDWGPAWPDGFLNQTATVTCVDGFGLLALDALPLMSPADATSYEEVVSFDQPSLYYRLGEPEGTKVVSHARKERKRHKHESRRHYRRHGIRHWTNRVTGAEVEGISGPAGTYKSTPTLAQPGLILGDTATCVLFGAGEYARIGPLDEEDLITRNRLTLEAWVEIVSGTATSFFLGPEVAASPVFTFGLSSNVLEFFIQGTPSNITVLGATTIDSSDGIVHVVGTWDGTRGAVYLNGVEDGSTTQGTTLDSPDPGGYLKIGPAVLGSSRMQEAAVYEKSLSAKRVLAHYTAGSARGYAEQLAGDRIEAIVTSDLWSEAGIQTGSFDVQPTFQFGQGKLDEIVEAVDAENPDSHFYFNGTGAPVYLGWDHKAASPYNAAQAVFGNDTAAGEVQYVDLSLSYDDEMFNRVTVSADGGEEQTVDDTASQAAYNMTGGSRAFERTGLPLSDDADAATIAGRILDGYATPQFRMTSLSLAGNDDDQRTQILERQIGEPIRIKHRPKDGTAIDIYTYILGRSFSLTLGSELHASWTLARGFNAGLGEWHLGVDDASNLGETAVLA